MSQPILQVEHLKKYFPAGGRKVLRAVDDAVSYTHLTLPTTPYV